jgi:serine/threonine protein kinase
MPLDPGTRLGPYEIVSPLGAGGMGEVYRAKDTRLDRTVAIKILAEQLSRDPIRKQRFEREAKAISGLNHPNICTLHDIGSQDGTEYLVMEYLDGESLAQRLLKGPLPSDQVLKVGREIADALDRAHRSCIIHRDLKPGNIMLTKTGAKLLDFGLARPASPTTSTVTLTASAAPQAPVTQEGTIVGTYQYMSPEQVEGKDLDARSDIFSLGAVLYEMVTGQRAFEGKSQLSVASAILEKEPAPISTLKPMSPRSLDHVIRRCLAKDPDDRWQTTRDVALELDSIMQSESVTQSGAVLHVQRGSYRKWFALGAATMLAVMVIVLVFLQLRGSPPAANVVRSSILPPLDSSFTPYNFSLSPDGTRLAFVAVGPDGMNHLWVRVLSAPSAQDISGTEDAIYPFWAPDSRRVGFFAEGKLKTVDTTGGAVKTLCDAPVGRGGTWNREGTIVFVSSVAGPLNRIPETGGDPVTLSLAPGQGNGNGYRWPYFLPDGKHFVYFFDWNTPGNSEVNGIYVGSLNGGSAKLISQDLKGNVEFSDGQLLYVRDRSLVAQPFNPDRLEFTGPAVIIAEQEVIEDNGGFHHAGFSASQNGTLVIQSSAAFSTRLIWYDGTGKELGQIPGSGFWDPRLSPDGRLLAVASDDARNGKYYVRVIDLASGRSTRITDGGKEGTPVWSSDGKRIAYTAIEGNSTAVYQVPFDGFGSPQLLVKGARKLLNDWSLDGHLVYMDFGKGLPFLGVYAEADQQVSEIGIGAEARFSPDGKWIARIEPRTRYQEIVVQPSSGPGVRIQISQGGGAQAVWRKDGKEIYYLSADRKIMAATFDPVRKIAGTPRTLFQTHVVGPTFVLFQYDVAPGHRFLINSLNPNSPLTLIANWPSIIAK